MDEKKQIEEMAKVIEDANEFTIEGITNAFIKCKIVGIKLAVKLYNAGYRKQSEAIDEFAERLKKRIYNNPTIFTQQRFEVTEEIDILLEEMKGGAE